MEQHKSIVICCCITRSTGVSWLCLGGRRSIAEVESSAEVCGYQACHEIISMLELTCCFENIGR